MIICRFSLTPGLNPGVNDITNLILQPFQRFINSLYFISFIEG